MSCLECEKIKEKKNIIYENNELAAVLSEKPASIGHIALLTKQHFTIIEQIPDSIFENLFVTANKLSVACFEALNAHGTNIMISNGVAAGQSTNHAIMNIIPRFENDSLNFHWKSTKADDEEITSLQSRIKSELESPKEERIMKKEENKAEEIEYSEENYMLKQLERMP